MLQDDYLTPDQLRSHKRAASLTKHAIWILPFMIVLLAPVVIAEGISRLMAVAVVLISIGAITSYMMGSRWERRWDALIREKSRRRD